MTNSNTDKKIGRLKAGTWGRTSGGYSPAAAKQSKRAGSKGARRVAKDDLRKVSKRGRLSGDRGLYERISNIIESDPGGDTDKKTMALHNKRIEKEMKKKGIKTNWSVKETAEYLDIPENVVEDIREDKGRGPTGLAYTLAKGHPDAENPKTREKYPERQTPEYKAKWKKRSGPGLKQYTGNKDVMKEQGYHNTTGMDPNDATPAKELEDERSKRLKAMRLNKQKQKGKTQKFSEARKMYDGGRAAKTGWDCGDCGAEKNRSDQCRSCGSPKRHHVQKEEKYPSSLLLKGNKDAAKKSKAERQDEKQRKLERAKHDTGGFRISDADAKKAKARLKKKYGPYARHFREFAIDEGKDYSDSKKNHYQLYSDKNDHHKAHDEIHKAVTHKSGNPKHMFAAMKKHSKHGAEDTASREQIHGHFMKHHADKKGKTWSVKEEKQLDELSPATLKRYTHKVLSDTPPHELDSKQMKNLRRAGKQIFKKEYSKTGKPVKDKKGKTVGLVHEQQRVVESLSKLMSGGLEKARKSIKAAEKRTGLSVDASKNPIGQIGSFGRPQKKRLAK